jgi:hypothetical protein
MAATNSASISDESRSARLAADLADAFARQYLVFRARESQASIHRVVATVQQQRASLGAAAASPRGQALQNQLRQLQINGALISDGADVVALAAIPASPASPGIPLLLALALVLGFVLATAIALVLERTNRLRKDESAVEQAFELPVLGVILGSGPLPPPVVIHRQAFRLLGGAPPLGGPGRR